MCVSETLVSKGPELRLAASITGFFFSNFMWGLVRVPGFATDLNGFLSPDFIIHYISLLNYVWRFEIYSLDIWTYLRIIMMLIKL